MYSRISGAKDGRASIKYAEGSAHNNSDERNIFVEPINMLPDGKYADQMEPLWRMARKNHKIQTRRIVVSFSKKELDPMNNSDINVARNIIREFVEKYYPNRQAVCFFQRDGRGGCLHCHIIVNDIGLIDHKGCTRKQQHYKYVRHGIDTVAAKYIILDNGEKCETKLSRTERIKAEKAKEITALNPNLHGECLRKILIDKKAYSYKADLKQRIHESMIKSSSEQDFIRNLKTAGIDVTIKISPKYGKHYIYDFVDCPIGVKNRKARSYKLGFSYGPSAAKLIWDNKKKQKTDADEFAVWMKQKGKTCFEFDEHGHIIRGDFYLLDQLRNEYEAEKLSVKEISFKNTSVPIQHPLIKESVRSSVKHAKQPTSNKPAHQLNSSVAVNKKKYAVKQLIDNTEEILRLLAEAQIKRQTVNNIYNDATETLNMSTQKGVKQYDKQL